MKDIIINMLQVDCSIKQEETANGIRGQNFNIVHLLNFNPSVSSHLDIYKAASFSVRTLKGIVVTYSNDGSEGINKWALNLAVDYGIRVQKLASQRVDDDKDNHD